MAGQQGPPSSWGDPPPGNDSSFDNLTCSQRVDGSHIGPTLPPYMDKEGTHGELMILRLRGVENRPLPTAPFLIRKSIQSFLGVKIEGAFPETNGSSYALKVRNSRQFQRLLEMKALVDGTPVEVIEHPILNTVRCVVSCRDAVNMSESDLNDELADQGIREVRRITRKVGNERVNTPALILSFSGTRYPEFVDFGYVRCRTRPYYPAPMQCFNCWAFGHTKTRCKAEKQVCGTCSGQHPIVENTKCQEQTFCCNYQVNVHAVSDRRCPAYQKENEIQRIKVNEGISYPAARRPLERQTGGNSYANVVDSGNQNEISDLKKR